MEPIPPSPEEWRQIVENACGETGWGDKLVVAVESTLSGWRVTVQPIRSSGDAAGPVPE